MAGFPERIAHPAAAGGPNAATVAGGWRPRLGAALVHLLISVAIAAGVLLLVYRGWYAGPLADLCGVASILVLMLTIDVILGPMLTFVVFDRRKRSLPFDLACIGALQVGALVYGLMTVEVGRPAYLAFVKDRFEVVAVADLRPVDLEAAAGNPSAARSGFGPRLIAVVSPTDPKERSDMLVEAAAGGRDLQHFPKLYRPYDLQRDLVKQKARPLAELRRLNASRTGELADWLAARRLGDEQVMFLPVRGPKGDATALVRRDDGELLDLVALRPWD